MKKSIVRRTPTSTLMCLFLLMLMLSIIPRPAGATLYTYTGMVTGGGYNNSGEDLAWSTFSLSIQFTYDGPLPVNTPLEATVPFTMTSGAVTLWSGMPRLLGSRLMFYELTVDGDPKAYEIYIKEIFSDSKPAYWMTSATVEKQADGSWIKTNWMRYYDGGDELAYQWGQEGVWTQSAVPLPATVLLLGSGLIPLAWARRKKRLGK